MEINIFDRYDAQSKKLIHSLETAGIHRDNYFVHYDGDLPAQGSSPYTYFTGIGSQEKEGLFFDKVKIPQFYGIRHIDGGSANIEYLDRVVGKIHYRDEGYRLVNTVEWYSAENIQLPVKVDRYNRYGQHYSTTFTNENGAYLTEYYDASGDLIISENLMPYSLVLHDRLGEKHFDNLTQFFIYYLKIINVNVSGTYINSLSYPLFISRLLGIRRGTTLFWQEPLADDVPGNMKDELITPKALNQVVFMNYNHMLKVAKLFPKTEIGLNYLSPIGEFVRENHFRMSAFILTNSDNIYGIRDILTSFPELNVTIAAYTNMSQKLLHLEDEFSQLTLIPSIDQDQLSIALAESDIYLDINYGLKVDHIIERAYQQHMIILSYKEVAQYDTNSLIFEDVRDLCNNLSYILTDRTNWQTLMTKMIDKNGIQSTIKDYQKTLNEHVIKA